MKIKEMSREFTKAEKYLLTMSPDNKGFKDLPDGTSFPVKGYLLFEDEKEARNGEIETSEVLAILSEENEKPVVYAGQSKTFYKSLKDIESIMGDEGFNIIKISGKTKAGRDYVDCKLDISLL